MKPVLEPLVRYMPDRHVPSYLLMLKYMPKHVVLHVPDKHMFEHVLEQK